MWASVCRLTMASAVIDTTASRVVCATVVAIISLRVI